MADHGHFLALLQAKRDIAQSPPVTRRVITVEDIGAFDFHVLQNHSFTSRASRVFRHA
ncbi:MAG: hypothetical protein BWZ01_01432 [Deltaproteobacteria bacterium ADurb.BinA179]|nr:MAG: hypothetical protein BWZ01_01432 [Deltaproteobacteria bacterium ADurb.BinA179]